MAQNAQLLWPFIEKIYQVLYLTRVSREQVQDLFLLSYISSASGPMSVMRKMHNQSIIKNADFSGGPVVKNLPANEGNTGPIPGVEDSTYYRET